MKRVFLPFDLPVFDAINSNHPLLVSLVQPRYDDVEFVRARMADGEPGASAVRDHAAAFAQRLRTAHPPIADVDNRILEFLNSRDFFSQSFMDQTADLAFFHTAPVHLDQMPWILHVENITTLFHPMLIQGECQDIKLRELPAYWFVRTMLESERCRGIFTNLLLTKTQIDRVFQSESIAKKTRHVPAGPYFSADERTKIAAAVERRRSKQEVEILFTNSWHQRWRNFFLRGGLELVLAFLGIERHFPDARLILRTVWPDILKGSDLEKQVRAHPKITLLESPMTDDEMLDLFTRADIFALDAASVHSVSILRAMYCAAACIVSDAPGYEEYVTHGQSAIALPGRRAAIYSVDSDSGWVRDDFRPVYDFDPSARTRQMAETLAALLANRPLRLTLGLNARRQVQQKNSFAGWCGGFEGLLREALESG